MLVVELIFASLESFCMDEMLKKKKTYYWVPAEFRKQKLLFHNISDTMCYETVFGGKQKHEFKHVVSRAGGEGDKYVAASGKNIPGQI